MKTKEFHGGRFTPEYSVWQCMIRRCYNQNRKDYPRYGGRGITVCNRWRESFAAFLADMGPRPSSKHSLDREKNNQPYCPENCRWATAKEQARNRRSSAILTLGEKSATIAEWSEVTLIPQNTIAMRLNEYGWSVEKALTTPVRPWSPGKKKPQ